MDVLHQYNWGKFLLDKQVREISHFRQGMQRVVGGCLLFLQLFYYESVVVRAAYESALVTFLCLFSWGEEEISEREKQEKELGGIFQLGGERTWDGVIGTNARAFSCTGLSQLLRNFHHHRHHNNIKLGQGGRN